MKIAYFIKEHVEKKLNPCIYIKRLCGFLKKMVIEMEFWFMPFDRIPNDIENNKKNQSPHFIRFGDIAIYHCKSVNCTCCMKCLFLNV